MGLILLSLPRADHRGGVKCQLSGGPGGTLKATGIWGQAGGGAEARAPTGAERPLSRHTKGLSSLSIPSQEEAQSRRRELAKKLLTWVDFVVATAYPRRHIPEGKLPASHPLLS